MDAKEQDTGIMVFKARDCSATEEDSTKEAVNTRPTQEKITKPGGKSDAN